MRRTGSLVFSLERRPWATLDSADKSIEIPSQHVGNGSGGVGVIFTSYGP